MSETYELDARINAVIEDLRAKAADICKYATYAEEGCKDKVNEIRDKALDILNKAANKAVSAYKEVGDEEEMAKIIAVVSQKSQDLHDGAIKKIMKIMEESMTDEMSIKEEVQSVEKKNGLDELLKEIDKERNEEMAESEFSKKALEVLKGLLDAEVNQQ